jgi:nitrilase
MKTCRVAVVQAAAIAFDTAATIARFGDLLRRAATPGVELVLFPEAFVPGFPSGLDWGGPATGIRLNDGQEPFLRYAKSALVVPSAETAAMGAHVAEAGVFVVVGIIERIGSSLSCSILHFNKTGAIVHVRRKLMPTMAERTIWGQSDGASLAVIDAGFARVGTVICWENYMPLLRQSIYAQNVEIYCAPTADDLPVWVSSMQHIALEARCFVLSANQFTRRSDFPADYGDFPSDDPDFIVSHGGSCIIDPFGTLLAGPIFDKEAILSAELDADQIIRGRFSFDVSGHYARPDVFQLSVDRRPRSTVIFND